MSMEIQNIRENSGIKRKAEEDLSKESPVKKLKSPLEIIRSSIETFKRMSKEECEKISINKHPQFVVHFGDQHVIFKVKKKICVSSEETTFFDKEQQEIALTLKKLFSRCVLLRREITGIKSKFEDVDLNRHCIIPENIPKTYQQNDFLESGEPVIISRNIHGITERGKHRYTTARFIKLDYKSIEEKEKGNLQTYAHFDVGQGLKKLIPFKDLGQNLHSRIRYLNLIELATLYETKDLKRMFRPILTIKYIATFDLDKIKQIDERDIQSAYNKVRL